MNLATIADVLMIPQLFNLDSYCTHTSFRLKDKVHIQDLDSVGLITPEIEKGLSEPLCRRLAEVRASE
jgi:hypothetical protein